MSLLKVTVTWRTAGPLPTLVSIVYKVGPSSIAYTQPLSDPYRVTAILCETVLEPAI